MIYLENYAYMRQVEIDDNVLGWPDTEEFIFLVFCLRPICHPPKKIGNL